MFLRKVLNMILVLVFLTTLVGSSANVGRAQPPEPPGQGNPEKPGKITQPDREAAAKRAAEGGFTPEEVGIAQMPMPGAAPKYFSVPNYANSPLPGNIVSEWNATAQELLQPSGGDMMMSNISMSTAFVYLSYMQAAVYDALVAIEGGYQPYTYQSTPNPFASREAAVAAAAYHVLNHYVPSEMLDGKYAASLAAILDGPEKDAGIAIGQAAADSIIALRTGDGLLEPDTYTLPEPGPGVWEPTMLLPDGTLAPPMDPWMALLKPFLRTFPDEYRSGPPPDLASPEYAADLNEVKEIGGISSVTRTAEQTEVAQFWATNMVIQTNKAYRKLAESRDLNLIETARLMALGNMVATDSLIATFDIKYHYNYWRPVTAIQRADTDGNDATIPDPTWQPLVVTPNFPEYVAGHGSFVSSQAEVFTQFFGTSQIEIDLDSDVTHTTRHYSTADEMRTEIINARTWGGLHFRNSSMLAVTLGQQMVLDAITTHFLADPTTDTGQHAIVSGGMRKFVDTLPGIDAANANNLGQYIPTAISDQTTYPDADYYEIALVEFEEKMHSDLPPTTLRGYVQLSTDVIPGGQVPLFFTDGSPILLPDGTQAFAVDRPHYMGPLIAATKDKPVRILFRNLLPIGAGGDLFIPVDTTVMGSGMGALMDPTMDTDPQNPMCGMVPKPYECYTENRATVHLHGGITPWISDGTPHQWITPANENTPYPEGVSVENVPDMPDPGPGAMTLFYTNQQSARLMFYHDHSWGITRLNVYAGHAAPYTITDPAEQQLIADGILPVDQIPLVIQDKTFVPSEFQLAATDPLWDIDRWGGFGDLWLPHVYSPAQNPGDSSGVNQFGRWAYGPWFWPPTLNVDHGPIANPYYDETCNPDVQWCEPPLMPGVPFNSMGMEAFMDTPVVNGTAYPTLTVDPKAYRLRILNAANDRFFNLSFYMAIDAEGNLCDANTNANPVPESTGVTCTEVLLNPDEVAAALEDSTIFPTPDQTTAGPSWIQIATEGGFLPAPAVLPPQPTTWVNDPTVFNAGNVDLHSLLLGPAERGDAVVDFSAYAGKTLILYNDAPAAFPARDPRYDYYTGDGDYRDTGGTPPTLPGYGPNTRTVMKIVVNDLPAEPAFDLAALNAAFAHHLDADGNPAGVFESSQHPIIVGQGAYNSAYGTTFQNNGPLDGLVQIFETSTTFATLSGINLTMPLQPKQIQDEMGEAFEKMYGRMEGNLGVESPNPQAGAQNMILYAYMHPPTEIIDGVELAPGMELEPISTTDDGTQLWKITHNGVDTHPIHFHLYDVQLLNRVGWDGIIRRPDANELGWKETIRISPLEDTIVALRPKVPQLPWDLPNSIRLLDPSMPEGALLASSTEDILDGFIPRVFDPSGEPIDVYNHFVNYGWEYMWHCHILSHEEMDMMRPVVVGITPKAPTDLVVARSGNPGDWQAILTWMDNALNETAYRVYRSLDSAGPWEMIAELPASADPSIGLVTYTDILGAAEGLYHYQVQAINLVGDTWDYTDPQINEGAGFPTLIMESELSNIAVLSEPPQPPPAAPTNLTAVLDAGTQVVLTWTDNAIDETGFIIERAVDGGLFTLLAEIGSLPDTGSVNYTDSTVVIGSTYEYRVAAVNDAGQSAYSNTVSITVVVPTVPQAPTNVVARLLQSNRGTRVRLTWVDNSDNETGFTIQRATNATFTTNLATVTVGPDVTFTSTGILPSNWSFYFRVRAFNADGTSEWVNATPFPITIP